VASDNAMRGQLLSGPTSTAIVGAEVDATFTSVFLSIEGRDELGEALKEIRGRLGWRPLPTPTRSQQPVRPLPESGPEVTVLSNGGSCRNLLAHGEKVGSEPHLSDRVA
jgi:hypothetical protein